MTDALKIIALPPIWNDCHSPPRHLYIYLRLPFLRRGLAAANSPSFLFVGPRVSWLTCGRSLNIHSSPFTTHPSLFIHEQSITIFASELTTSRSFGQYSLVPKLIEQRRPFHHRPNQHPVNDRSSVGL